MGFGDYPSIAELRHICFGGGELDRVIGGIAVCVYLRGNRVPFCSVEGPWLVNLLIAGS